MAGLAILEALLKRPVALLVLRFSNILYPRPVTYDELHARLRHKFAAMGIELPLEATVKADLDFLVQAKLLEMEGVEYRITPPGAEAAKELSPRSVTTPV